jgi:hypothetical protein
LEGAVSSAVGTIQNAVTNVLEAITGGFPDSSSNGTEGPSKEVPQPSAPFAPPVGGSSFSLSGGGQIGAGGVAPLLLLCALALGLVAIRWKGKLSKAFCEVPKLSSALLAPLERPG